MRLPYFSRSQLGVILLLGAALLLVYVWRANFFLPPSPPPDKTLNPVFVEVTGAAAHPGVYSFDHPPSLAEVWYKSGASVPVPADESRLASGTRVAIAQEGTYRLGRMAGETLLTLGLALDLNSVTAEDLDALPGIGPVLAKRIIDYRQAHGPFKKIDDLMEVSGIGPQNLQRLKPHLVLETPEATMSPEHEEALATGEPVSGTHLESREEGGRPRSQRGTPPKKTPGRVIDPNRASQKDLEALPGIGPVLAKRILDYRQRHGPFKKIDDLMEVSGIGPKKLEQIKPYLIIVGQAEISPEPD